MDIRNSKSHEPKKDGFQGQKAIIIPRIILKGHHENYIVAKSLYITDIGYYPKAKFHFRERLSGSDQNILICCEKGKGKIRFSQYNYEITAGEFVIIPARISHTYEADISDPWSIYWVHFQGDIAHGIIALIEKRMSGFKGFIYDTRRIFKLFLEIYGQLENGYSSDNLTYTNMCFWHFLTSFIVRNENPLTENDKTKNTIDIAIDFFKVNINKTLGLNEVAHFVNISPSHFSFLFKNKTGFSPIEYFNHLKIQKACQYLLFTESRIKEISFELGIEDQYYFSRLFKKVMGVSPESYRKKRKA